MGLVALIGILDAVAVAVSAGGPCGSAFAGSDAASVMVAAQTAAAAKPRSFMWHWRSLARGNVSFTRTHRLSLRMSPCACWVGVAAWDGAPVAVLKGRQRVVRDREGWWFQAWPLLPFPVGCGPQGVPPKERGAGGGGSGGSAGVGWPSGLRRSRIPMDPPGRGLVAPGRPRPCLDSVRGFDHWAARWGVWRVPQESVDGVADRVDPPARLITARSDRAAASRGSGTDHRGDVERGLQQAELVHHVGDPLDPDLVDRGRVDIDRHDGGDDRRDLTVLRALQ